MELAVSILAVILVIWGLAILQASFSIWLGIYFIVILILFFIKKITLASFLFFFLSNIIFYLLFCIKSIRIKIITASIYNLAKKLMPKMSNTEKEAIEAGETWWDAELFSGNPDWKKMLSFPKAKLSTEEQQFLDVQVENLCNMVDDWTVTHEKLDLSLEAWNYIKKEKFFGMHIPKKYGGLDFSATANSTIIQKIASHSVTAAVTVMVPNSLGPAELLLKYGTEEQKEKYLPDLASGKLIPCFALTSEEAGSDASSMVDSGIVCKGKFNGKEVLGLKLNWNKRYITLAPVADLLGLAFRLYDPDQLLGEEKDRGITVCLVPTNLQGIEIGKRHFAMNIPFMNGPTRGKDVFVPLDNIIGGEKQIGKGWRMLIECLSVGRGISLPSLGATTSKHAFRTSGAYSAIRKQFNTAIGNFEGIQEAMARIGGYAYLLEAARVFTTGALDRGIKPAIVTAIVKYHMTELGRKTANDAMDIHGGKGVILGRKNYLGRLYQSMPISITVEGANILTRCLMIFGQGVVRCHPYLKDEITSLQLKDRMEGLRIFDANVFAHINYVVSNFAKLKAHLITGGIFYSSPTSSKFMNGYFKKLSKFSLSLACCADISLLLLGGKLKIKERLSARLGDILSYLYLASSILKFYKDEGEQQSHIPFVTWSMDFCIYEITLAFSLFFQNFPNKFIAKMLKFLIFPFGYRFKYPKDKLGSKIAKAMMENSDIRQRLTKDLFVGNKTTNPISVLETAFAKLTKVEKLLDKVKSKQKEGVLPGKIELNEILALAQEKEILSKEEVNNLMEFEILRKEVISVDEFTESDLLGRK